MAYVAQDYSSLIGVRGFSRQMLEKHFGLYEGYVRNANKLIETMSEVFDDVQNAGGQAVELKNRLAFELNGVKLHEYYFSGMSREAQGEPDKGNPFCQKVAVTYGSYQNWKKHFRTLASLRGIGWAIAFYDADSGLVINTWVDEHHLGHVAGTSPILVLDLWEHAMLLDYGTDREKYIDAFFNAVDWPVIAERFERALERQEANWV